MIVVIDANAIVGDPRLTAEIWIQLAHSSAQGATTVLVPRIALEEAKQKYAPGREKAARTMEHAAKDAPVEAQDLVAKAAELTRAQGAGYEDWLEKKLVELGFEIAATPEAPHDEIAKRAMDRRRPFNDSGGGYRDTLHWYTMLASLRLHPDEDFVLVSNDTTFASEDDQLDPRLEAEAGELLSKGSIRLVRKISEVKIPGRYRGEVVETQLSDAITQRIERFVFGGQLDSFGLDPASLGFTSAAWIDLIRAEGYKVEKLEARELEVERVLEVTFTISANVDISVTELQVTSEGDENFDNATETRKLQFTGIARSKSDHTELDSLEELSLELYRNTPTLEEFLVKSGLATQPLSSIQAKTDPETTKRLMEIVGSRPARPHARAVRLLPREVAVQGRKD